MESNPHNNKCLEFLVNDPKTKNLKMDDFKTRHLDKKKRKKIIYLKFEKKIDLQIKKHKFKN